MHKLKILLLEDIASDAEFIKKYLQRDGLKFEATIATSKTELIKALEETDFDIVLADHSLTSMDAVIMVREKDRRIPFILIGGTMSEETAIDIVRNEDADDYVLIDHIKRLPTAIRQAMKNKIIKLGKELCESKLLAKDLTDPKISQN